MNYNDLFETKLVELVSEDIERLKDSMTNKLSVPDHSSYCYHVGVIAGLRSIIELCDVVRGKLAER